MTVLVCIENVTLFYRGYRRLSHVLHFSLKGKHGMVVVKARKNEPKSETYAALLLEDLLAAANQFAEGKP